MPKSILVLKIFGYMWNTVAGTIWVVLLSRSGWMVIKPVADVVLPLQQLFFPWESLWQSLESAFALGLLIVPLCLLLFAPGPGALILATWLEERARPKSFARNG